MKKKLLMAAVGAALVAGPIAAQAAATVYGHFHLSMDRYDNDVTERGMMASNASRFGIKGNEDLGGGLKAIYQMETGVFAVDEGGGGLGGTLRNTFVGFAGSWGTVKLGRHDTPYKDLGRKLDNFNEQVGDMRTMIGNKSGFDARPNNVIRYESPKFAGGWQVNALHTSNASTDVAGAGEKDNSVALTWSAGPLFLGAAWNEVGAAGSTDDPTGMRLLGSYSFNDFVLGLFWESLSDIGGVSGADRDVTGVIASMKTGNNKLKFHWFDSDKLKTAATDDGGTLMALGVDHSFSKTTSAYVNYASVDNNTSGTFNTASGPAGHGDFLAAVAGKDAKVYSVGVIINF
jgi:predicted porin